MRKAWIVPFLALALAACGRQSDPSAVAPADPSAVPAASTPIENLPVLAGASVEPSVGGQATEAYNITLRFVGNPTQSFRDAANAGARRWERTITAGLASVALRNFSPSRSCGASAPNFTGTVDDILIDVGIANIDGAGQILAQAGPCIVRSSGGLTIYGSIIFDSADLGGFSSQVQDILVHEMGHVLGVGTLWQSKGLLSGAGTSNPSFVGPRARTEYAALGGSGNVPVENTGGAGTRDGHWRETTFRTELMTGFLNSGVANPLSRMSIASLGDLGYTVNTGAADAYSLPTGLNQQTESALEGGEQLITPRYRVQ